MKLNGAGYTFGEPEFPAGKPLYNLDRIAAADPAAPVWIVEGEKAADALTKLGAIATTSGGADSAGRADWSPLRGRECRLWRDNDEAGAEYAGNVAVILLDLGCQLSAVDVDPLGLPPKGDAWDWQQARQDATLSDLDTLPRITPSVRSIDAPRADIRLCVLTLAELLLRKFPERESILAPFLLTQSLVMIHAWRGIGKTFLALCIAYAVATGGKFLTWSAPRPRRVLYLDGEMPGPALKARLAAMVDTDERDFDPGNLLILTPDAQDGPMPDLATNAGQAAVEAIAAAHNVELIIVDNISTLCRDSGPENDAESWRTPQEWALRMRRTGRSVLFIHHSGKGGAQRGSSKREDTLDAVLMLKRPADYLPEQGARFEIHFEKYRNGSGDEAKAIEACLATDAAGRASWTWKSVEEGTFERVVALANEGLRPSDIANELEINKSTVSRHMKRGRAENKLTTVSKE